MASDKGLGSRKRGLLKEQLELEKYVTKEGRVRYTVKPLADQLTFDKGFYVFIRAVQLLKSHNDGVLLIGLAGPSGSGKTAFSHKVRDFMPGVAIISMDMYNDGSKVVDSNFDDPRLTDYELLMANLTGLKNGEPAEVPIYDFQQSKRIGYQTVDVPTSRVVIIEGIYALSDKLRPLLDMRVSITGGVHFDLVKRVLRDISRSGQGPEEIISQITDTVYPMYKAFIEPNLQTAQLRIYNAFNPFTGFMNATYILKSDKKVTEEEAIEALGGPDLVEFSKESEILDIYLLPPNEDPETCQCWLRMRNKEGRYSLMFEEWMIEGPFIISPRITFEVSVRVLGGLMALGYEIGTIMQRTTKLFRTADLTIKLDSIQHLGDFIQIHGKDRDKVAEVGSKLQLDGTYIPRSYIEQVQLSALTKDFAPQSSMQDIKARVAQNSLLSFEDVFGHGPMSPGAGAGQMLQMLSTSAPTTSIQRYASAPSSPRPGQRGFKYERSQELNIPEQRNFKFDRSQEVHIADQRGMKFDRSQELAIPERSLHSTRLDASNSDSDNNSPHLSNVSNGTHAYLEQKPYQPLANSSLAPAHSGTPTRNGSSNNLDLWSRVSAQLTVLTEHAQRGSNLQLQVDALAYQYKHSHEQLESLKQTQDRLLNVLAQFQSQLSVQGPGVGLLGPAAADNEAISLMDGYGSRIGVCGTAGTASARSPSFAAGTGLGFGRRGAGPATPLARPFTPTGLAAESAWVANQGRKEAGSGFLSGWAGIAGAVCLATCVGAVMGSLLARSNR